MAKTIEPEDMDRDELIVLVQVLIRRQRIQREFMETVGIFDDYMRWLKLKSIRRGG